VKSLIRAIIISVFIIFQSVLFFSCDEEVNPKVPFTEKYILNFVIRGDTSYQIATLSNSYDVPGLDPYENINDPSIKNADIRIWHDDKVIVMQDTVIPRQDISRYKDSVYCYYLKDFSPVTGKPVEVRVITQSGNKLYANTKIPQVLLFDSLDLRIPKDSQSFFSYVWQSTDESIYYIARFRIFYRLTEPEGVSLLSKEVPVAYVEENGKKKPVYPKVTTQAFLIFQNEALDSAMKQIGGDEAVKSKYKIYDARLEVLIFDNALSKYYASIHSYLDEYSIRIDESDYTNVSGGLGIFGSYLKQNYRVVLKQEYVKSFGYEYGFY